MVVDAEISLVQFVYPFLFEAKTLERRKEAVSKSLNMVIAPMIIMITMIIIHLNCTDLFLFGICSPPPTCSAYSSANAEFPFSQLPVMFRRNVYCTANCFNVLPSSANHSITAFP
jgi:hypothetical protein